METGYQQDWDFEEAPMQMIQQRYCPLWKKTGPDHSTHIWASAIDVDLVSIARSIKSTNMVKYYGAPSEWIKVVSEAFEQYIYFIEEFVLIA